MLIPLSVLLPSSSVSISSSERGRARSATVVTESRRLSIIIIMTRRDVPYGDSRSTTATVFVLYRRRYIGYEARRLLELSGQLVDTISSGLQCT